MPSRPRDLLRIRPYRLLVLGNATARLGNAVSPVALAFAVLDRTGSATALGLVVGARSIANVALVLVGGVVADRLPRRAVMVGAAAAAASTQLALAVVIGSGHDALGTLVALAAANGAVAAVGLPAVAAVLPETVPAQALGPANALNRLGVNAAGVVGTSLAGVLVAAAGSAWAVGLDAFTFAVAAVAFAAVRVPPAPAPLGTTPAPPAPADPPTSVLRDLRLGWSEFRRRTWVWSVVAAFTVLNAAFAGAVIVLGPVVADASFGRAAWGFVLAGETVGYLLGGLLALRLRVDRLLAFGMSCMLAGALPPLALAAGVPAAVLFVAFLLAGVGFEQFSVAWDTAVQSHVPRALLARVYSFDMFGSFVAIPAGQLLAGPAQQEFGLTATLAGAGGLILLAAFAPLTSGQVRGLRRVVAAQ